MKKTIYIQADKASDNSYNATEIVQLDAERSFWNLEYGDVVKGNYQIWEYPSGKIYTVTTDRELEGKEYEDYYGMPNSDIWLPVLTYKKTDQPLVSAEYHRLKNVLKNEDSWWKRTLKNKNKNSLTYISAVMIITAGFVAAPFTSWLVPVIISASFLMPVFILSFINWLRRKSNPLRKAFGQIDSFIEFIGSYLRF